MILLSHWKVSSNFLIGKSMPSMPSKAGKKPSVLDDNRRATYNISSEPVITSESILTTFEGETKQFIAVCSTHVLYYYFYIFCLL